MEGKHHRKLTTGKDNEEKVAMKKDHENIYSNTVSKDLYKNMQNTQAEKMAEIINLNNHLSKSELSIAEEKNSETNKKKQNQIIEEWQVKRNRRLLNSGRMRLGTCKVNENDASTENKFTSQKKKAWQSVHPKQKL
ncbi:hypothetical protein WA026_015930 [Henosepilachna vigintioctopunctata]|uniref:Uncharacterized protein n=1 Tax=Henosepilachna vigintioctopunctata TaxID=420089 RepID=A0AAW1U8C4_9CUCU